VAARLGTIPVLIIAADSPDERAVAADFASRASRVEIWQTTGIGHVGALDADPDAWRDRVGAFLARALVSNGGQ
jgi:hypothetical protein